MNVSFNSALCSACGLATAIWPHYCFSHAADLSTSPLRPACFRVTSCTSAMIGVYALRSSLLLTVWLRCRFIQAATALFLDLSFVALLLLLSWACVVFSV